MISVDRRLYIIDDASRSHALFDLSLNFFLIFHISPSLSFNRTAQSIEVSPAAPISLLKWLAGSSDPSDPRQWQERAECSPRRTWTTSSILSGGRCDIIGMR